MKVREQVLGLCRILYNKKAMDVIAIDVADKTIVADWFIICSGRASTQTRALCDEVEEHAHEMGLSVLRKEGYADGRWIVLDFGHILLHIFHSEEREYYNLERLWMDQYDHCIFYSKEQDAKLEQEKKE